MRDKSVSLGGILVSAVLGISCLLFASLSLSHLFGYQSYTVMSGSMTPTIRTGDLTFARTITPLRAKPGDIISFRDPVDRSRLITHRVRSVRLEGLHVRFTTRGDANTGSEHWTVPVNGRIGLVQFHLPKVGYVMKGLQGPLGRLLLIGGPALLLASMLLFRIWLPQTERRPVATA